MPSAVSRLPSTQSPTLLAIVGPTASGKSDLAMKIAKKFDGEIISADSRTIYKGMDIGTAKPSTVDRRQVKHWGLDLVEPGQRYSAAQFKTYAEKAIKDIQSRGKLPVLVGGTGLYVDGVLYDFSFVKPKLFMWQRLFFPWWSLDKLQKMIAQHDWPMPQNKQNRRHLINTIRRQGLVGERSSQPRFGAIIIGLMPPDNELKQRIDARAERIFAEGIIEETRRLAQKYKPKAFNNTAGIVYKIVIDLLRGKLTNQQAVQKFKATDWQYARRQKTWFKRNPQIKWFNNQNEAYKYIQKQLLNT